MKFTFMTLFPELIASYFGDSILKKALDNGHFSMALVNPRDFSASIHHKVDDTAVGGGAGMVMAVQPLRDALLHTAKDAYVIVMTPVAKPFTQQDAKRLAKQEHICFVSGRYEGIDERFIEQYADEVLSIGDYILTGGELPSLVCSDAIARMLPGVLGNKDSLIEESFEVPLLEAPCFTKPASLDESLVPSEYLKGNHSRIQALKFLLSKAKTAYFRPEALKKFLQRGLYEK